MFEGNAELKSNLDAYYRLMVRRKWWILFATCGILSGTIAVSLLLPDKYLSEATIIVEQQQVPERYDTPTTPLDLNSALQAMTQDVLSRPHLLQIIDELGLYEKERKHYAAEELAGLMRKNIEIKPLEGDPQRKVSNSFRISFRADAPHKAQQVTSRLTTLFIGQSAQQAVGTTGFHGSRLEAAREEMQKQEQRLKGFRMEYAGEIPEQQQRNWQILIGLHMELQNTVAALDRAQKQRLYIASLLNQPRRLPSGNRERSGAAYESPTDTVQRELNRLNANTLTGAPEQDTVTVQLKIQLEANQREIENRERERKRLEGQVAIYEQRLNLTPVREQQLAGMVRDYNLSKQNYEDLLKEKTQSELAPNLEQQQGKQLRIVDPPNLPTKPTTPNRIRITLCGLAGGLCLAIGLAMFMEARNASFHTEGELKRQFAWPIVLGIPPLPTPSESRMHAKRRALEWLGASVLLLVVLLAEAYVVWQR